MSVQTYSPKDLSVSVGGITTPGYAVDTYFTTAKKASSSSKVVANDEVTQTANADKHGKGIIAS